jgi:Ser/Thr protein kinase RdoA (MazF antagonist)
MLQIDFNGIVREALWNYDSSKKIASITDISARVSTNHVYRIKLTDENVIIAKLSYFGKFEHFVEDHTIINALANNLPHPFENVLARSLMKGNSLFVHRHKSNFIDAWVVFYRPMRIKKKPPKKMDEDEIRKIARSFARFHKACKNVRNSLPPSSKTLKVDIYHLLEILETKEGQHEHRMHVEMIKEQCYAFIRNVDQIGISKIEFIPVFVDWNIGNFSVTPNFEIFSRWDYDWFRMSTRMMDFYFFSRIVSRVGDKTIFSYEIDRFMEERFILFLKAYHQEYPLTRVEILLLKETYRFFLLNYVVKYGRYFFHDIFATRLQQEAYNVHLPTIDEKFNAEPLLKALNL